MHLVPDDTREQLQAEAGQLRAAMRVLRDRFPSGKHNSTALAVQQAAAELASRARHPSRQETMTIWNAEVDDDLV